MLLLAGIQATQVIASAGLAELGFFELEDPRFEPSRVLDHVPAINAWYAEDEPVTLTPEYASAVLSARRRSRVRVLGSDEERDDPRGGAVGKPNAVHDPRHSWPAQPDGETGTGSCPSGCTERLPPLGRAEAEFFGMPRSSSRV